MSNNLNFESRLKGGHPNSFGNTVEIVEEVLQNPTNFHELFECYFSEDDVVRLRVSNAIKRIAKINDVLVAEYLDRLINEISKIDQTSTQWTLSQLFLMLKKHLSPEQKLHAIEIMKNNLANHNDWIVLNQTIDTSGKWAKHDASLKAWLKPHLLRLTQDPRKSVKTKP